MNRMIIKSMSGTYAAVIVIKTSDSPFDYLDSISECLKNQKIDGRVLIDELLHSGNGEERFIEAMFSKGSFDASSFKFAHISKKDGLRSVICDWLREDPERLEYTDLSMAQQKMILSGLNI